MATPRKTKTAKKSLHPTKPKQVELTEKEEHFCREYVCDAGLNATRAYRSAFSGVSYNTAKTESCKLLTKPYIQARIEELKQERYRRLEINPERVLFEVSKMAFYDPREFFNDDGQIKPLSEIDPDHAKLLCSLELRHKSSGDGSGGVTVITKIKLPDKQANLELLGKHLGLFNGTASGKVTSLALQAVADGEISARDAAYKIAVAGEPLPEILRIELSKVPVEDLSEEGGVSLEQLEERARAAYEAVLEQREYFVPSRQTEVKALKQALEGDDAFRT